MSGAPENRERRQELRSRLARLTVSVAMFKTGPGNYDVKLWARIGAESDFLSELLMNVTRAAAIGLLREGPALEVIDHLLTVQEKLVGELKGELSGTPSEAAR